MAWSKQYGSIKPYKKVKCIAGTKMLYPNNWYDVIKEDNSKYLIKFNSGGTKWYSKIKFVGEYTDKATTTSIDIIRDEVEVDDEWINKLFE